MVAVKMSHVAIISRLLCIIMITHGIQSTHAAKQERHKAVAVPSTSETSKPEVKDPKSVTIDHKVKGFSIKKGTCQGKSFANLQISTEECASKCRQLHNCRGFTYIYSRQKGNSKLRPCFLSRELCTKPSQVKGLVIYSYYKTKDEVAGFTSKNGGCGGKIVGNLEVSLEKCASACQRKETCGGFGYLFSGQRKNKKLHACLLMEKMCPKPRLMFGMMLRAYYKSSEKEAIEAEKTSKTPAKQPSKPDESGSKVDGFTSKKGNCMAKLIIGNLNAPLKMCASRCQQMEECSGFVYKFSGQRKNKLLKTCVLLYKMCHQPSPTDPSLSIYAYYKTSEKETTEAEETLEKPGKKPSKSDESGIEATLQGRRSNWTWYKTKRTKITYTVP